MREDRKITLLRAAWQLLNKQKEAHYVLEILNETVFYDDAECDGSCLMDDIEHELGAQLRPPLEPVEPS